MYTVTLVTTKNKREAKKIASKLINDKIAACVNIVNGVESVFSWKGKADKANEALLIIKSKKSQFRKLASAVKSIHSYKVCEIISLPIVAGNKEYLNWIDENTKGK